MKEKTKRNRTIDILRRNLPGEWRYDPIMYEWIRSDGLRVYRRASLGWGDDDGAWGTTWYQQQGDKIELLFGHGMLMDARPPKLSREVIATRAPRPPHELVDALQDSIHLTSGRLLAAKSIRKPLKK